LRLVSGRGCSAVELEMSLSKETKKFRINMLILVIEALLPFLLLFALRNDYTILGRIISAILVLGIIYLVVFK
jgi:hypothetical protein